MHLTAMTECCYCYDCYRNIYIIFKLWKVIYLQSEVNCAIECLYIITRSYWGP